MTRIGIGFCDIPVMATSREEAEEKALDEAGNYEYSEKDSEYVISSKATEQIINVIEKTGDKILSINSFLIKDSYYEKETVREAEEMFCKKAAENGLGKEHFKEMIDMGCYLNGDYAVYLTWSDEVSSK